jgi:hypothetical protein
MSHAKRIIFWTILLIGSAVLFYFWATNQMRIIKSEEMAHVKSLSIMSSVVNVVKIDTVFYTIATSSSMQILLEKNLDKNEWSSSTLKISPTTIDSTDFSFIYPNEKSVLYQNCTYDVRLNLGDSLKPNYIGVVLVDAGTQKEVKSKDSGLVYSLTFKDNRFKWSVGNIWSGEYYLHIPIVDGQEVVIKSKKFSIEMKPEGYICEK